MTSLALACRLGAVTAPRSIPRRVRAILNKYGATMLLPGSAVPILGPELVVNGDFSQGTTGWSSGGGATISVASGSLRVTQTTSYGSAFQNIPVSATGTYQISVTKTGGSTQNQDVSIGADIASGASGAYGLANLAAPVNRTVSGLSQGLRIFLQVSSIAAGEYKEFDNISVREILGYQNTYSSFIAGNYRESTGQTLAAADQQIGLVVDAVREPGPNVAPALEAANWAVANTDATHIVTWQGGGFRYQSDTTTPALAVFATNRLVIGKTYEFLITVSQHTSGAVKTDSFTGSPAFPSGAGTHRVIGVCQSTSIQIARNTTNVDLTVSAIQVRELPGIQASQSTSGFQPVLRRGLVNLLTYSNDFGNTAWVADYATKVTAGGATQFRESATSNYHRLFRTTPYVIPTSAQYTFASKVRKAGRRYVAIRANFDSSTVYKHVCFDLDTATVVYSSSGITGSIKASDDGFVIAAEFTSPAASNNFTPATVSYISAPSDDSIQVFLGDTANGFDIFGSAIFQGAVTAEEIIAAGGIPVTTSAPASSANGVQSWRFDGTDDRLSLSAVPFQMADDHFVVAGINPSSSANDPAIFSVTSTTNNNPVISLGLLGTGVPRMWWRDDAGTFIQRVADDNLSVVGSNVVLSGVKRGSTGRFRKNGIPRGSIALSLGAATFNAATVGAFTRSTVTSFLNGHIHGVIFGKGAISDSELLTLERFMATLQGRTL